MTREDLFLEATALVYRAECRVPGESAPVVMGLRGNGWGSVYFGSDPVYHFNQARRLRRGYCDGRLIKAEKSRLVALARRRTPEAVHLVRHELDDAESRRLLGEARRRMGRLAESLRDGSAVVLRVSDESSAMPRLKEWIAGFPERLEVADRL